ncbi:helix-turn-helix domain-containing protein [Vreelandella subterranea]
MEQDEPKRRIIRDAAAVRKQRGITQVQMAEELGVPCRTLEEWLQGRRYPKGPGMTLIRRWVVQHSRKLT